MSATDCVAVGNEAPHGPPAAEALVETFSQGKWSTTIAPAAPGGTGDYLFSVSCPTAGRCVAVGYVFTKTASSGNGRALIETLANGTWSVTPTPSLGSNVADSFLFGVSCSTLSSCVAVGGTSTANTANLGATLILTLRNGAWSVTPSPRLGPSSPSLQAVSCVSPTSCTAVGYQATSQSSSTVVESLGAAGWSVVSSPGSRGPGLGAVGGNTAVDSLNGLSCVSQTSCVAVGRLNDPVPTIDELTNQQWSAVPSPDPNANDAASSLNGVSCTASTCVAVGNLAKTNSEFTPAAALGAPLDPLIETNSGGTWAITPNPSGLPADSGLIDVSCAGQHCVGVGQSGQFTTEASTAKTLILQTK